MNKYTYGFAVICPNDGEHIYYTLVITSGKVIMVEDIISKCSTFKTEYQEAMADKLLKEFGGFQSLTAVHQRVEIETTRK